MKHIVFIFLIAGISTSCNDVEFNAKAQVGSFNSERSDSASLDDADKDPNFNDDGIFIDNVRDGAEIVEITSPLLDPISIGNEGERVAGIETCFKSEAVAGCLNLENSQVFIGDSFERSNITSENDNIFNWRAVINDNGKVVNGTESNNVEFKTYDNSILGETSNGDKSLYFTGRSGGSVHNLYLITKPFNLSDTNGIVYFSFDYLPIGLEAGEYLRLEVCNNTLDQCGVGSNISVSGLNGVHWKTVFESNGQEARSGLNGFNHLRSDWINKQLAVRLDGFQRENFVFRLNAFMNEGFHQNNPSNGVNDAVGIDNFKAFTFLAPQ